MIDNDIDFQEYEEEMHQGRAVWINVPPLKYRAKYLGFILEVAMEGEIEHCGTYSLYNSAGKFLFQSFCLTLYDGKTQAENDAEARFFEETDTIDIF